MNAATSQNLVIGPRQILPYNDTLINKRYEFAGAFMPTTNEILICGGLSVSSGFTCFSDFISVEMDAPITAKLLSRSTPMDIRHSSGFTSNHVSGDFYVHGGNDCFGIGEFDDFWMFNVKTRFWTRLARGPSKRLDHCLTFDSIGNELILFGGQFSVANKANSWYFLDDLWIYSVALNRWIEEFPVSSSVFPGVRARSACALNPQQYTYYVQGGSYNYQDLWEYDFNVQKWTFVNSGSANNNLQSHSMDYLESFDSLLLFPGYKTMTATLSQTWSNTIFQYSFKNPQAGWVELKSTGGKLPTNPFFLIGFNPPSNEYYFVGGESELITKTPYELWKIKVQVVSASSRASASSSSIIRTSSSRRLTTPIKTTQVQTISSSSSSFVSVNIKSSESLAFEWQGYLFIIVAVVTFLVVLAWTVYYYRRKGGNISRTRTKGQAEVEGGSLSSITDISLNDLVSISGASTSSSSVGSGGGEVRDSKSSGSLTLASTELGLSVPAYMQIDFNTCIRVKKVLAQGGFGTVMLADALSEKLRDYGDQVIVKQLKKERLSQRDAELFYQEIALMSYFRDEENLVKLIGFSIEPFCIVMKYYQMGSLRELINKSSGSSSVKRSKRNICVFSKDIARGLLALHTKGVIHNDLKPENVLLDMSAIDRRPQCVLADLGISQIVTEQILKVKLFHPTRVKALSVAYAAPERIIYSRKKITKDVHDYQIIFSWDLYALGIVIFELVNGRRKLNM